MPKMFINKDGLVYSGVTPKDPEDIERLGPDEYMQSTLTETPQHAIDADAAAIGKKRMSIEQLLIALEVPAGKPLPGSATYPDEVELAEVEAKRVKEVEEMKAKLLKKKEALVATQGVAATPAPVTPAPATATSSAPTGPNPSPAYGAGTLPKK
jgi:hypothetical protein